jgi:hypothetical protein
MVRNAEVLPAWGKLHNEEVCNGYFLSGSNSVMKTGGMGTKLDVTRVCEVLCVC